MVKEKENNMKSARKNVYVNLPYGGLATIASDAALGLPVPALLTALTLNSYV